MTDFRVDNIVENYKNSTGAERRAGTAWYPAAYSLALSMDPENTARAAGVIAALSPQQRWSVNMAIAAELIGWADAGADMGSVPHLPTFTPQLVKAIAIAAHGVDPLDVLHGPKERAFYGAIMGHADAVVVDRWAARAADPEHFGSGDVRVTAAQYRKIAEAYRAAARIVGRPVRDVQATVWIHVRGAAD